MWWDDIHVISADTVPTVAQFKDRPFPLTLTLRDGLDETHIVFEDETALKNVAHMLSHVLQLNSEMFNESD